jgi:MFS transporter, SHS family, lactate transporter
MTDNIAWITPGFGLQRLFGCGGMQGQMPPYLNERFPTEVHATASTCCFHQGAIPDAGRHHGWRGQLRPDAADGA